MCSNINYNATTGPSFDHELIQLMRTKFLTNLNVFDTGAVIAAQFGDPIGPYSYHWMRVGALSYYAYM